jgi:hypothetical protein
MFSKLKPRRENIEENINRTISNTPYNKEFKEKVIRALLGDYTEEDIKKEEEYQKELLNQLESEFLFKECIGVEETKVIFKDKDIESNDKQITDC